MEGTRLGRGILSKAVFALVPLLLFVTGLCGMWHVSALALASMMNDDEMRM